MSFPVTPVGGALVWNGGMEIDADGAPNAYAPAPLVGLDYLANAGHADQYVLVSDHRTIITPEAFAALDDDAKLTYRFEKADWYGVVIGPDGKPVVQGPDDPCPGFLVSQTALFDHTKAETDPTCYVNSVAVPYITCTRNMESHGVRLGDLAWVLHRQLACGAIIGDVGPRPDEGSVALASAIGVPASPKHGGADAGVSYVVFPGSALQPAWPRDAAEIQKTAQLLFEKWGGVDKLNSLLKAPPSV